MKTEHTPGPWKHDGDIRVTSGGGDICVVLGYGQTRASNIANAELISSAPELLEALETLSVWLVAPATDKATLAEMKAKADAAIAKAKGQP